MKFLSFLQKKARQIDQLREGQRDLARQVDLLREALGRIEARQSAANPSHRLADHEFRVFSQWGEDGIIEYLLSQVEVPRRTFVEFGVEDYREANTRFLLMHRGWEGLVIDASEAHMARLRREPIFWQHHLQALAAYITRENINELIASQGITGPIGLLSIDIDGNDYWVWEALDVVQPAIVVIEYNGAFGRERAVSVKYEPKFDRFGVHFSGLYVGASLAAMVALGRRKGYAFVGTNRAGNNAFFVQRERLPATLSELTVAEGYTAPQFREGRNIAGDIACLSPAEVEAMVATLPLVEVPTA